MTDTLERGRVFKDKRPLGGTRHQWRTLRDNVLADAHESLPSGTRFELRQSYSDPGMAWCTGGLMEQAETWTEWLAEREEETVSEPEGGYILVGRQVAGQKQEDS